MQNAKKSNTVFAAMLIAAMLLTAVLFLLMYRYDNKFTYQKNDSLHFLTGEWEIYEKELTPTDLLKNPTPDYHLKQKVYSGLNHSDNLTKSLNDVTYHMRITIPAVEMDYMLELPKFFPAYRLYINGKLMSVYQNDIPINYNSKNQIQGNSVVFTAKDFVDIVANVSVNARLNDIIIDPPVLGSPAAVTKLFDEQLIFRAMLCFITFTLGMFYLVSGLVIKHKIATILFGFICLLYLGYICHPILHALWQIPFLPLKVIENFSFYAFIFLILLLQKTIFSIKGKISLLALSFSGFITAMTIITSFFQKSEYYKLISFYNSIVIIFEILLPFYLIIQTILAIKKGKQYAKSILIAFMIFSFALIVERSCQSYAPIRIGRFTDIGCFLLIAQICSIILRELVRVYRENTSLAFNVNTISLQLKFQEEYYSNLLGSIEEAKKAKHDLRHHLALIQAYAADHNSETLHTYIDEYKLTLPPDTELMLCENHAINAIVQHYANVAAQSNITVTVDLNISKDLPIADSDLCVVFGNLLENAIEACVRTNQTDSLISVHAKTTGIMLGVIVENNFVGNLIPKGDSFLSLKRENKIGVGIPSIRAIAQKYQGEARFETDYENSIFTATVLFKI